MTAPLTDADLVAARALAEKATPGEWRTLTDGDGNTAIVQTNHLTRDVWQIPRTDEDLDFIAAARTLVPRLCDAVEEARRERDEARNQRDEFKRLGQQFERDGRTTFEQSCANLRRAETAERERDEARARVEKLEAALRDYMTARSRDITGTNLYYGLHETRVMDRARALLSPTPSPKVPRA